MRPVALEFTAFGSYPDTQSIDFSKLGELGLYVVTGPTGSGKTTIFDAMAYALYGDIPGARETSDVRSHHAAADATCSVSFRFAIDGVPYLVERTPEQTKPRSRGTGNAVKVTSKASLVRESDGKAIASGARAVTTECQRLVGLDSGQFERVVVLPQGRFQQFLLANSTERMPLLRQLFGTGRWDTVVRRLKDRADEAESDFGTVGTQLERHRLNIIGALSAADRYLNAREEEPDSDPHEALVDDEAISLDDFASRLASVVLDHAARADEAVMVAEAAREHESRATKAKAESDRFDRYRLLADEAAGLDASTGAVEEIRRAVDRHDAAEPVIRADETLQRALTDAAEKNAAREAIDLDLRARILAVDLEPTIGSDELAGAIADLRRDLNHRVLAIDELLDSQAQLERHDRHFIALGGERDRIESEAKELRIRSAELGGELQSQREMAETQPRLESELERIRDRIALRADFDEVCSSIAALESAQARAVADHRELNQRFINAVAPRLAESLVEGEPCSVCGSTIHPLPAQGTGDDVSNEDLELAATRVRSASSDYESAAAKREILEHSLGDDATKSLHELEDTARAIEGQVNAARASSQRCGELQLKIDDAADRQQAIAVRLQEIASEEVDVAPRRAEARTKVDSATTALGVDAERAISDPAGLKIEIRAKLVEADDLLALKSELDEADRIVAAVGGVVEERRNVFADALTTSPFSDLAGVIEATIDDELVEGLRSQVSVFDESRSRVATQLEELLAAGPLPDERPEYEALNDIASLERSRADRLRDVVSRIGERLETAGSELERARETETESAEKRTRFERARSMYDTASGKNAQKIVLETWVLASELDRVAAGANHHLARMSGSRYRLERSEEVAGGNSKGGLDLVVFDSHTGRSRRPGSLSGGEQFQASLALALGLADVIGHGGNANGRVFEALFVDEGFGSLDPDSLDQAVDALTQIQASGRTVGVITHVEAMKETLPIGIRVDHLPNGRGSSLTVRPND